MRSLQRTGSIVKTLTRRTSLLHSGPSEEFPKQADVLIIGGGAVGCSIAYHLAKLGVKDVVLAEKTELTAGSTWHAAGLTALYHPTPNLKHLHYYSINLYSQLEKETGQIVGFHQPGSIRLATSPVRVDEFKYQMSRQSHKEAPQKIISPEAIQKLCPILNMDNILAGLYNPNDGHIDPYSMTQALAIGARKYGAKIYQHLEITAVNKEQNGDWLVSAFNSIQDSTFCLKVKHVVNAAGFWAKEIGDLSEFLLPLVPIEHQYLITAPIDEVAALEKEIPVLRHLDGSFYLRQEGDGSLLLGPYESEKSMKLRDDWVDQGIPKGFGKELFPSDLDRLTPHLDVAMELVPTLKKADIKSVICGPITYTPDLLPMVGPTLKRGYWLAVGFGYGIIHAGGIGRYLAEWIMKGEPPYELIELDPGRYGPWTNIPYVFAKARESYGMNNAVPYPHEERMAGRPTERKSGIYETLLAKNGQMSFHSGWEQPSWFVKEEEPPYYQPSFRRCNWHSAVLKEWNTVRNNVGVIDLSPFGKFMVSGRHAKEVLNNLTANHVPQASSGVYKTCITHCLTKSGKVYAEWTLTSLGNENYLIVTGSGSELHDLRWLQLHAENKAVTIKNVTDELGCIGIAGPKSEQVLKALSPDFQEKRFQYLSGGKVVVDGIDIIALKISYTGELGWELYCKTHDINILYGLIMNAGLEHGIDDFGTFALQVLRMEKGFRMWGADMNKDTSPFEAGLQPFIKMQKGCFIGFESLQRELQTGVKKHLVPLVIESSDVDPKGDEAVWCAGKVIGNTTSGCFSYSFQKPLAFAYVPPFLTTPGTELEVELLGQLLPATVISQLKAKRPKV